MMKTDDINDQAITKDKIRDGNVTAEKLADGAVSTDKLPDGAIKTPKIADGNITTSKLAEASVVTSKIADHNVTKEKIADQSVDNSKLSPEAVTYDKLKDKSVITEKLNDRAVTTEKIEEKAITNAKLGDQSVDGRVVREASLETKHFANESVTTEKVARKSITKDKLADNAVDASQVVDGSIGNAKLSPDSVTTEKIKDGSVTNEKVADDTLGIEKFDPELRKTIQAATGLPEDLSQMIQDVDKSVKQLQEKDTDLQSQIDDKQQQITANDDDISLLQTRSTQMEEAIKSISASGGASQASAVTYENTESGLDSVTAQGAIDELASKKFNKDNIAQEFGDSKDKVVSQFALPFREIESPEFIKAIVDAEDHFLFGIQLDGSIEWGKGIPAPIRTKLQEIITQCQQDKTDLLESINTINGILDKTTIKDEEGTVVETPFRYIQSEEFIFAKVDAEDKLLFGFQWDGTPVFGKTSVVEERLQAQVNLLADKIRNLLGDDDTTSAIDTLKELKDFFANIDNTQTLTSILANLNATIDKVSIKDEAGEIQDTPFMVIDNEEYLSVEKDSADNVLSATYPDGSHYIHNAKSETIPTEFSHIEDPEGRTEITTDEEGKILGYRDSEGVRHEHKISAKHIELSNEAAKEVNEAFKSAGIKMENPSDFSKDSHIELPIPRIAAKVRLYAPKLPTTKQDDIEAEIEYNDKDGNYFRKPVILNAQGSSSMNYYVKNMAIDINDGSEIKFGDFPTQDSFHLKKYYIDAFRGQCIVGYWLMEQVYKSRPIGQQYPYEYSYSNESTTDGLGDVKKDFFTGAKCHPDGFPINITWINTQNDTETDMGIYAWNLKKSKEVYYADKKKAENIILDGEIAIDTLFGGTIKWDYFEIRNPKSLIDIEGNKYDGDNPKELSDTDPFSKKVKGFLVNLSKCQSELSSQKTKTTFEKYFIVAPFIDYVLLTDVVFHNDGLRKNWIWVTYNGLQFTPTAYDLDSIFGSHWMGLYVNKESATYINLYTNTFPCNILYDLYKEQIELRYKELRDLGIFSVTNIVNLLERWINTVGYDNYKKEFEIYKETPSYRNSYINAEWEFIGWNMVNSSTYNPDTTYNEGDICVYAHCNFKAKKEVSAIPPLSKMYDNFPYGYGMYNSIERVSNWLEKKIETLDIFYNYKSN